MVLFSQEPIENEEHNFLQEKRWIFNCSNNEIFI